MRYSSLALMVVAGSASLAHGEIELIGTCAIPGTARDLSGLTNPITETIPHNLLGSFGSAIEYSGKDDLYFAADDRGPGDGKLPFRSRVQTLRITIDPARWPTVTASLVATTLLSTESGSPLTGLSTAFSATNPALSARFDAEGLRLSADGTWFISDEYGPFIDEFGRDGKRLRRLAVPGRFAVSAPDGDPAEELANSTSGRRPNHGFEGLAISPDKATLYAMPQAPLIQDSERKPDGGCTGINVRMLELPVGTGPTRGKCREFVYQLEHHSRGVNELLAISDHEFLALERDSSAAKVRAIHRIDVARATDVSGIERLPARELPAGVTPVSKSLFLDLCDPKFGLTRAMPEKIEGLTWGPTLPDGRRTLIVTSDNDLKPEQPTWIWVFACEARDLEPAARGERPAGGSGAAGFTVP